MRYRRINRSVKMELYDRRMGEDLGTEDKPLDLQTWDWFGVS